MEAVPAFAVGGRTEFARCSAAGARRFKRLSADTTVLVYITPSPGTDSSQITEGHSNGLAVHNACQAQNHISVTHPFRSLKYISCRVMEKRSLEILHHEVGTLVLNVGRPGCESKGPSANLSRRTA